MRPLAKFFQEEAAARHWWPETEELMDDLPAFWDFYDSLEQLKSLIAFFTW